MSGLSIRVPYHIAWMTWLLFWVGRQETCSHRCCRRTCGIFLPLLRGAGYFWCLPGGTKLFHIRGYLPGCLYLLVLLLIILPVFYLISWWYSGDFYLKIQPRWTGFTGGSRWGWCDFLTISTCVDIPSWGPCWSRSLKWLGRKLDLHIWFIPSSPPCLSH